MNRKQSENRHINKATLDPPSTPSPGGVFFRVFPCRFILLLREAKNDGKQNEMKKMKVRRIFKLGQLNCQLDSNSSKRSCNFMSLPGAKEKGREPCLAGVKERG